MVRVLVAFAIISGVTAVTAQPAAAAAAPTKTIVGTAVGIEAFTGDGCQWWHEPWGSSGSQGFARSNCSNPNYTWFRTWGRCSYPGGSYSRSGPWQRNGDIYWSVVYCDWGHRMTDVWIEQIR